MDLIIWTNGAVFPIDWIVLYTPHWVTETGRHELWVGHIPVLGDQSQ